MKSSKFLKRFYANLKSVKQNCDFIMEDKLKSIFYASVESVKPSELITKKKLLRFADENNRNVIEINCGKITKQFDVTKKNIHMGNLSNFTYKFGGNVQFVLITINIKSFKKKF
jgi:hypothetical protein